MHSQILPRLAVATALTLVAGACSAIGTEADTPAPPRSSSPSASAGATDGAPSDGDVAEVLRFSAPRLGGGTIDGEDFSGRDTAFWFWAPW
ncbi:MAG: hypothetical protein ACXWYQ_06815 [Actinomycetota bacterium]